MTFLSLVELNDLLGINREPNIGIDNYTEKTRIRLQSKVKKEQLISS